MENTDNSAYYLHTPNMEGHIRDCANKLEGFLEFHQIKPKNEEEVRKEIASFGETAKKLSKDYIQELSREEEDDDDDEEEDDDDELSKNDDVAMVGNSKGLTIIRAHLLRKMRPVDLCVYSYLGEEGTGRTLVVNGVYEELSKCKGEYFDCWARVRVKHDQLELKQVLMSIITQIVEAEDDDEELVNGSVSELSNILYRALENRRYMILLADVDDAELVDHLKSTSFPDQKNGSLVLITTASSDVAELADSVYPSDLNASFFLELTWRKLRTLFFEFGIVPSEMEEAGNKIIQNCRCRMIAFSKTLLLLIKTDVTVEQWRKIAADEENPIYMVADEISEVNKVKAELQSLDVPNQDVRAFVEYISRSNDFSYQIENTKIQILPKRLFSKMEIISLFGMAGIGKTTFARKIFKESLIERHFDYRVWITLSPKYKTKYILIDIFYQMGILNIDRPQMKRDDMMIELRGKLLNKRCLIVLDNLCSKDPLHHLKYLFPDIMGTTLITTRLAKVTEFERDDSAFSIDLLDEEESWILLHQIVFAGKSCPPKLEKVGRVIAEKCDGLPLLILKVAEQLLKVKISEEYWNQVASGKKKSVFKNAHDQISKMLLPSYQGLPQYLKPCFLYLGVFREKHEIHTSKLTNLWICEGFLEINSRPIDKDFVTKCLWELANRSLVMIEHIAFGYEIKRCRHHSVFWHLSNSQAMKNKFFNAVNSYDDCSIAIKEENQRRLCIRNSSLLGIKDVQRSLASNTSAHSLLCVGPLHQFPVLLNFDLRLLRVMDALTIRLYEFPIEIVRLIHLRYLGLTCNGKLPKSISNLWKLEYLLVKRYMNIKSSQNSSLLPVEIWEMKELKHLEVMGGCLPNHKSGPGLLKLTTLLDADVECCRKKVLKWIPNLKRLGIRIELAPGDESNHSFRCLNRISRLRRLESLKCVVVNPRLRSAPPPVPWSMFPQNLKKLSLSGLAYPWEYMCIIGRLKNLQVLKLKQYAFVGSNWNMEYSAFSKLKFLLIEDTNLVVWKFDSALGVMLEELCIKHCYKLKKLPFLHPIDYGTIVEIVECSSSTVAWAKQIEDYVRKISISSIADIKPRTTDS